MGGLVTMYLGLRYPQVFGAGLKTHFRVFDLPDFEDARFFFDCR